MMVKVSCENGIFDCTAIWVNGDKLEYYSYGTVMCSVGFTKFGAEQAEFVKKQMEFFKKGKDFVIANPN